MSDFLEQALVAVVAAKLEGQRGYLERCPACNQATLHFWNHREEQSGAPLVEQRSRTPWKPDPPGQYDIYCQSCDFRVPEAALYLGD